VRGWWDDQGVRHIPKRKLEDLIIGQMGYLAIISPLIVLSVIEYSRWKVPLSKVFILSMVLSLASSRRNISSDVLPFLASFCAISYQS